jgi:folate-binding protein YgfZ
MIMTWNITRTPFSLASSDSLPPLTFAHLDSWGTITIQGDDKTSFLQGQVTCNVATLDVEHSQLGAHCDAKGKMWSVFRLFHHQGAFCLFQPLSGIEAELRELKKYAIFSKVEINQGQDCCIAVLGEQAQSYIDQLIPGQSGDVRQCDGGSAVKVSPQRWLLLLDPAYATTLLENASAPIYDSSIWTLYDILEVQPALEQEEQNQHIPQAVNLQAVNGISFTKGCYTGQETVARAKYRGTNKRAMYRVSGPRRESSATTLERSVGENWRSAGTLLNDFQFSDQQATGLIILPNDLEPGTLLRLSTEPEAIWCINDLPYSLEQE